MKKRVLLAVAAALCLLAGCKKSEPAEYEKGMENLEKQKYEQAVQNFEDAIQKGKNQFCPGEESGLPGQDREIMKRRKKPILQPWVSQRKKRKHYKEIYICIWRMHSIIKRIIRAVSRPAASFWNQMSMRMDTFSGGSCYLRRNEYKKAENDFKKVISHNAGYQDYLDIYRIYQECGLSADGEEYLAIQLWI